MICVVIVCLLAVTLFFLSLAFSHFSPEDVDEVIALVRCVDLQELKDLNTEIIEQNLRSSMSKHRFKVEQGKRVLLSFEYLGRMSFNSWVMLAWAEQEQYQIEYLKRPSEKPIQLIHELITAGIGFRIDGLVALVRVFVRIPLMRMKIAPPPGPGRRLRTGKTDLVQKYRELANAALKVAAYDGLNKMTRLAVGLFGIQNRS